MRAGRVAAPPKRRNAAAVAAAFDAHDDRVRRGEARRGEDQPPGTMTGVPFTSHDWNVYESHTQSVLLVPQVVPWQL